jgi:hypothetical protein
MALFFFDSSALVKRYVQEQGSIWVREITANTSGHIIHISLLTVAEIASALARRQREGGLSSTERDRLFRAFLMDCTNSFLLLWIEEDVIQGTIGLVTQYPLRTADAIQLSTAVLLSQTLQNAQFGPVILASADDRLLQAASAQGLAVENPNLH